MLRTSIYKRGKSTLKNKNITHFSQSFHLLAFFTEKKSQTNQSIKELIEINSRATKTGCISIEFNFMANMCIYGRCVSSLFAREYLAPAQNSSLQTYHCRSVMIKYR